MAPAAIGDAAKMEPGKRILFATFGSLGDMHPCLALARELQRRGHRVTFATTAYYRDRVEALGLRFLPLRPDIDPTSREVIAKCEDLKTGPEVLFREIILPHMEETYVDLLSAAAEADLMLAGEMNFAAPLVSEKLGLPWISITLSPASFLSARDPSMTVNVPWLLGVRRLGWPVYRAVMNLGRLTIRHWWQPVRQLRQREGLRVACDPLFRDKFSPWLVLALFSPLLARKQADWPKQTVQPGFVFFDSGPHRTALDPRLETFLIDGNAPLVFTQGSTAVHNPGDFFAVSAKAALRMGRRAVLVGASLRDLPASPGLLAVPYAAYAEIFPRASVIVHQGGSGTTGEAMRAGRPMLIVPYGWDQPDNAMRVQRLGIGLHLARKEYNPETATTALEQMFNDPRFAKRSREVAERMNAEDGLTAACDEIECVLTQAVDYSSD